LLTPRNLFQSCQVAELGKGREVSPRNYEKVAWRLKPNELDLMTSLRYSRIGGRGGSRLLKTVLVKAHWLQDFFSFNFFGGGRGAVALPTGEFRNPRKLEIVLR